MTDHIKRELRRRSAIEPVIGHLKSDHRMDRNFLASPIGEPSIPSSPPSDTTSPACSNGWRFGLPKSWRSSSPPACHQNQPKSLKPFFTLD
jgi:hypothetical protein